MGQETGARGRTRSAILAAAASALARDRAATLPDIAAAAGVGRTTLHRYFPDRESLIAATIEDSFRAMERSVADAAIDQGSALDALRRLVVAMVDVGDRLMFLFGDPHLLEGLEGPQLSAAEAEDKLALFRRGQAEGVFDPELDPAWIQHVIWSLVYTGYTDAEAGLLPRHGVAATVIRTLENGIRPRQAPSSSG